MPQVGAVVLVQHGLVRSRLAKLWVILVEALVAALEQVDLRVVEERVELRVHITVLLA